MEQFDLLEQRVGDLLTALHSLREENRKLQEEAASGYRLLEENLRLQDELKQQQQVREEALARVDALVERLTQGLKGQV